MKRHFTLTLSLLLPLALAAQSPNLTPRPMQMTEGEGVLTLTSGLVVSYGSLPDSLSAEAASFVSSLNAATGLEAHALSTQDGLICMETDSTAADEGYSLNITSQGVELKARTSAGFFYGFQSIKKMLPANVMAGQFDSLTTYTLPCVTIEDQPRFAYRGFMLDVSRHFFTIDEVKRMIDLMAAYKMNRFHWHLTDDQGWRAEIKKYPLLTTTGATAENCRVTDIDYGTYWTNQQYGPYFYTQDEMREVVEYCARRHIMVIPEVDMPGHFVAAMAAYPEFSCTPNGSHKVWTTGGVSSDVLNVANPDAIQFVKDVIDELVDIFPAPYFHIGGDECPTTAWQNNSDCQALYAEKGYTSYRQLQSAFINEISGYLKDKGKRTVMWNESITASGADLDQVKEHNPVIMCWTPCQSSALSAATQGLTNIVTEYNDGYGGSYYINRKQSSDANEPDGAGSGDNTVEACYKYVPVPTSVADSLLPYYGGVQGTFWCEWVSNRRYLEYLALPRLMCIAEAGWTPQDRKDWDDFALRMAQDTVMLNLNRYEYGRHMFLNMNTDTVMPEASIYYHLQTMATDGRSGRQIELVSDDSPLLTTYSGKNIAAGRLWTNTAAQEGDDNWTYQQWTFEESPSASGLYAIVCQAQPDGSVNPTPTAQNNTGRWDYDTDQKNYSFKLATGGYGTTSDGTHYYTIQSSNTSGLFMNCSMSGQGMSVNLWSDATDGNSGLWQFIPVDIEEEQAVFDQALYDALPRLNERDTILIQCSVEGFENTFLTDVRGNSYLSWTDQSDSSTYWVAYKVTDMDSLYQQTAVLRNVSTARYIYDTETSEQGHVGYPVTISTGYSNAPAVTIQYQPDTDDYQLYVSGNNLFPIPDTSPTLPQMVGSGSTTTRDSLAARPQGAGWTWQTVTANTTGIHNVAAPLSTQSEILYNLSGQRVSTPKVPGVYIQGGKKLVLR